MPSKHALSHPAVERNEGVRQVDLRDLLEGRKGRLLLNHCGISNVDSSYALLISLPCRHTPVIAMVALAVEVYGVS